jgi:hypothetical protein
MGSRRGAAQMEQNAEQFDHHRGRAPLLRPTSLGRTITFVAISLGAYAVICAFWHYLSTGNWLNLNPLSLVDDLAQPLGGLFIFPLDIFTHPWMIAIGSLLLAAMVLVPVAMAVLYRSHYAAAFVIVLLLMAHAPLLAVATALGCMLAARTRLRSDMPFMAICLGLLPAGVCLWIFGFGTMDAAANMPLRRLVLNAPFIAAFVLAVVAAAIVLLLARLTSFRPGVMWPVSLALLAGPMSLFYWQIGPAELEYSLIANRLAPGDAVFASVRVGEKDGQELYERLSESLPDRKTELVAACNTFLSRHGASRRAPAVLWIRAQCASVQIAPRLDADEIHYTAEYPMPELCRTSWQALCDTYDYSPQAALACWRLGQIALREGRMRDGEKLLMDASRRLTVLVARHQPREEESEAFARMFGQSEPAPDWSYYTAALLPVKPGNFSADYLLWLMRENNVLSAADSRSADSSAAALRDCLSLDPLQPDYAARLGELAKLYAPSAMGDNLALAAARAAGDYETVQRLADGPPSDAAIEANYELGLQAVRVAARGLDRSLTWLRPPEQYFQNVRAARPNPFTSLAEQQLARLRAQGRAGS